MKLETYLKLSGISPAEFARRCDKPASTITRLLSGDRSPRLDLLRTILRVTGGQVTPNDFIDDEPGGAVAE